MLNIRRACRKQKVKNIGVCQTLWLFLCISMCRFVNVWIIRTQFDPDEYWQTLEPAYCLVFGPNSTSYSATKGIDHYSDRRRIHYGCTLTWEWTRRWTPSSSSSDLKITHHNASTIYLRLNHFFYEALHGPIRSYVSVLPTYVFYLACRPLIDWAVEHDESDESYYDGSHAAKKYRTNFQYNLKQYIRQNSTFLISKGPAFFHALLVAAPTDLIVWLVSSRMSSVQTHISRQQNQNAAWRRSWPFWALVCSLTSWFHGYALVRTYANSVETVLLMLGVALLSPVRFVLLKTD
jgi:hypothetical protein